MSKGFEFHIDDNREPVKKACRELFFCAAKRKEFAKPSGKP